MAVADHVAAASHLRLARAAAGQREAAALPREPWTDLYILRRGILPCSYGGRPIAPMEDFRRAWNAAPLREIRARLAAGEFAAYCYESPACPIVRKAEQASRPPVRRRLFLAARRLYLRLDRRLFGLPGRLYRPLRDTCRAARRRLGRRRPR